MHGQTPEYITDLFLPYTAIQALRSAELKLLTVPQNCPYKNSRWLCFSSCCTQVMKCSLLIVVIPRLLWHFYEAAERVFIQTAFWLACLNRGPTLFIAYSFICVCVSVLICVFEFFCLFMCLYRYLLLLWFQLVSPMLFKWLIFLILLLIMSILLYKTPCDFSICDRCYTKKRYLVLVVTTKPLKSWCSTTSHLDITLPGSWRNVCV